MDSILAVSFADRQSALRGLSRLREMDEQSDIVLREAEVVQRDAQGELVVDDQVHANQPVGADAAAGGALGLLIGTLGGPVGSAAGALGGTLAGTAGNLGARDEDEGLLAQFARHVERGTAAVMAHVEEPEPHLIDDAMRELGGTVLRESKAAVEQELNTR
jgi:uncharacterized membrane protein